MTDQCVTIVVADESAIVRERLITLLCENAGVKIVGQAGDIQTALHCIYQLEPDVVVVHYSLTQVNRTDFLRFLREDMSSDRKPIVIVLTNQNVEQLRPKILAAGADLVLDKSYELDKMTDFVGLMTV